MPSYIGIASAGVALDDVRIHQDRLDGYALWIRDSVDRTVAIALPLDQARALAKRINAALDAHEAEQRNAPVTA